MSRFRRARLVAGARDLKRVCERRFAVSSSSPTLTIGPAATPKQIQELKLLIDQTKPITYSSGNQDSKESSEDEEEYGASQNDCTDGGLNIAEDLQFHIACLVDLGFTLEQSFQRTEKGRVRSS